ncbi:hypothetical protein BGW42_003496 [Actinomortierella wolfii]|nr:hypothetical protein BGW42_003496 [Actinomortierella wolfii]
MQQGQPSGEHFHEQLASDSSHSEINATEDPLQPQPGAVHCFWALMTYGDLRFIYLSNSVQRAVNSKYKRLLGRSFFDYIHPDEAKLARKDLNAFMDVHNLYGSVTRCRFKNVCPDWQLYQQRRREQQQRQQQQQQHQQFDPQQSEKHSASSGNSGNVSENASTSTSTSATTAAGDRQKEAMLGSGSTISEVDDDFNCGDPEALRRYQDAFPNGEMDDYMILDVVMNVVSDQVVLGFFHIDGQGPYKGFWSGKRCGESKDSLSSLASEILRHLRASTTSLPAPPSIQNQQEKATASKDTKRIFQLYDSAKRDLLLTWPEPSVDDDPADASKLVYNPEFYTRIVQSHHIPADALANTTCLKRFCSKHAISGQGYPQEIQPIFQVESVFIPYGQIIFACFQTSPAPSSPRSLSLSLSGSPTGSTGTLQALNESSYMGGSSDLSAGASVLSAAATTQGSTSGSNPPLVIPSLPSLSPFLKHAVPSSTNSSGGGPIPSSPLSGGSSNHFHPYSKHAHRSGSSTSNSSSPLLEQPSKLGMGETDRLSNLSTWHASTPHPAIAAMVGHALSPSSPAYYRSNDNLTPPGIDRRLPFPSDHSYHRERTVSSSALEQSSSTAIKTEPDGGPRPRARTTSMPAFSNGSSKLQGSNTSSSSSGTRHPAHDAAIRIKTAPLPQLSGGRRHRESSSDSTEDTQHSAKPKNGGGGGGGDADSVGW